MHPSGVKKIQCKYLVIGGGIAGVSCIEKLCQNSDDESVVLISASSVVKRVTNVIQISKLIESFDVIEQKPSDIEVEMKNLKVLPNNQVIKIDPSSKIVETDKGISIQYSKLCLCTGSRPNMPFADNASQDALKHVLTIRDTESIDIFQERLSSSKRIIVVGNGGIASELVYSLKNVDIFWVIKDEHLVSVFCDEVAGKFLLNSLNQNSNQDESQGIKPTMKCKLSTEREKTVHGSALGPFWKNNISVEGSSHMNKNIHVEKLAEIKRMWSINDNHPNDQDENKWNVYVELSNGKTFGADFIVSGTGVIPNGDLFEIGLELTNSAINVDLNMKSSVGGIYAAGDVCHPLWKDQSPDWFHMRLWTQARQMGAYAGMRMICEDECLDFCFELFTHATKIFGFKTVLLGLYNAQGLDSSEYEVDLRITEGKEFVKVIKVDGKLRGAILIGETDLEEAFENLILNRLNIEGINILDPAVDIEDYFD